jgi:hypothetical protein
MPKGMGMDEIVRILDACLDEPHPLQRGGAGLIGLCRVMPLIDALTNEEVQTFLLPRLNRLIAHVQGCFPCTAKALVVAILIGERRPGVATGYLGRLHNHLNRIDERNDHRRDYRAEVEAAMARFSRP